MIGINNIKITPQILVQVAAVDEFKGLWQGLERHTTGLQLLGDVADYGANFAQVLEPLRQQPLTPQIVRALHASTQKQKGASAFKTKNIPLDITRDEAVIGSLETADPDQVEPLLQKLTDWVNTTLAEKTLHPLLIAAMFTAVFLQIGPFATGNIAAARFVVMLIMLKSGYTYAPYVSLAPLMNETAAELLKSLRHNQESLEHGRPDWSAWLGYFLGLLHRQTQTLYGRLYANENDLQQLPTLSGNIMDLFKDHKRLQMKQIIKLTNGRRATIKLRLQELVYEGYLRRYGQGRATWYSLI